MRNILGIQDDEELNAACDAEDAEKMEETIAKDICKLIGTTNLYHDEYGKTPVFSFKEVANLLQTKYGMRYLGGDEAEECHTFANNDYRVEIIPVTYYNALGNFQFRNFFVNRVN